MVQMTKRNPQSNQPMLNKIFQTYFFPELPSFVCQNGHSIDNANDAEGPFAWHHYSIGIVFDPKTTDISASTLMVDGDMVGRLKAFDEPIHVTRQSRNFFQQLWVFLQLGVKTQGAIHFV